MSDPHFWQMYDFPHDPYALTDPALCDAPDADNEDAGWWPPRPGERDEHGELVESLPETAELVGFWPADKGDDCR